MPAQPSHNLRADARRNRDRILDAARAAFTAQGLDVPLTAIARRAGVGPATLYRRFPTRAALVTEAFAEQLDGCVAVLDEALADPDPWRGFRTAIDRLCTMQAADRGFTAAFLSRFPGAVDYERERASAEAKLVRLVERAKGTGRLRADFTPGDITLPMLANCGVAGGSREVSLAASRRRVGLQPFRAEHAEPLPPPVGLSMDCVPDRPG